MHIYFILFGAIAAEVCGTLLLPLTQGFTKALPSSVVIVSYCLSFYWLSLSVEKLPLAIVYASWAGLGVFRWRSSVIFLWAKPQLAIRVGIVLDCGWRCFGECLQSRYQRLI